MLVSKLAEQIEKARESEAKTLLSSILAAQNAYYKEHKEYGSDFSQIGWSPEGTSKCRPALRKEGIAEDDILAWPEECLPYVTKTTFKASCVMDVGQSYVCYSIDEKAVFGRATKTHH